ncbi:hypothetical protein NDU88_005432 [Pleurodeles waltl]|uniref:Uncharacterized protein n=1 Tax=Pleurodeles waltl TaxID=8319 RepID=A0AAV7LLF8_PLEWA|nr:hypothetical protein NDU88_005432 [Pleurodeles waltl]
MDCVVPLNVSVLGIGYKSFKPTPSQDFTLRSLRCTSHRAGREVTLVRRCQPEAQYSLRYDYYVRGALFASWHPSFPLFLHLCSLTLISQVYVLYSASHARH